MDTYSLRGEKGDAHTHADGCRGQKKVPDALVLELQVVVSSLR